MKYLNVTYHMSRKDDVAETCIRLPMTEDKAAAILAGGYNATLNAILLLLALLQGYTGATVCCVEETSLQ